MQQFQMYAKNHPGVIIVDPLEPVCSLLDRTRSYQVMKECEIISEEGNDDTAVDTFNFL